MEIALSSFIVNLYRWKYNIIWNKRFNIRLFQYYYYASILHLIDFVYV